MQNHPFTQDDEIISARNDRAYRQSHHARQTTLALITALTVVLFGSLRARAQDASTAAEAWSVLSPAAQSVAQSINQARANAGLPALALHPLLNQAAQTHANDIVVNSNYSHVGWDGSRVGDRVRRTGYLFDGWTSENWVSVSDPAKAIQWWMNSYVHRNNILNSNWHEFGIGSGYHSGTGQSIFVVVFSTGSSGATQAVTAASPALQPVASPISSNGEQNTPYTVRAGDTLLAIALRFDLSWQAIASLNGLGETSLLQVGQIIQLPGALQIGGANSVPGSDLKQTEYKQTEYIVRSGDTLVTIAMRYGQTWQNIASANGLSERDILQIGQKIVIPRAASTGDTLYATPSVTPFYYVVRPGDTIISIAAQNGVGWGQLLALNGLSERSMLQIGQQIRIR